MTDSPPLPTGRQARTKKIPLNPPLPRLGGEKDYQRGIFSPPFGKWFGALTILSLSKEGGWEGFKEVIFYLIIGE